MRRRSAHRSARRSLSIVVGAVLLVACNGDDPATDRTDEPDEVEDLSDDPAEDDDPATDPGEDADDTDEDGDADADAATDPDEAEEPDADDGTDGVALTTEPTTSTSEDDGDGGGGDLAVADVRAGSHDGFDRVTFELTGDATAGWFVGPEDEPSSQGSGEPVEVEGDAYLGVALRNVTLPPELPEEIEPWDGERLAAPSDADVLEEVVDDTIFEGIHLFFIGLDEPVSYRIDRFEDPQRVVIDLIEDP